MKSSLSLSLKSASRLRTYVALAQENQLFPAVARRFASSLPPSSGDDETESVPAVADNVVSSGEQDDSIGIDSKDGKLTNSLSKVLFPWRHSASPVPRLIPGTPEEKTQGLLLTSKKRQQQIYGNSSLNAVVTAYMFLNVPWYELFWISHFQDELSTDISWSFTQGVASLLSNLPLTGGGDHIPSERIITDRDDGTIEIDFCEKIEISRSAENGAYRVRVGSNDDENENDEPAGETFDNSRSASKTIPLRNMFHEKAIELYQSSVNEVANHSPYHPEEETQRFELRLKMIPRDFKFVTLYAIPYLSRRNAKGDPDLLSFYGKMLNESSGARAPYLSKLRQEHLDNNGYMESTIIAQCLVWCDELFHVKDLTTGKIVQGREGEKKNNNNDGDDETSSITTPEMQKTPHLVRMERTVITKKNPDTGNFENEQENWIITDIDDLLDGNLVI